MNCSIIRLQIATLLFSLSIESWISADIVVNFGSGSNQFSITFVPITDLGNSPDTMGKPNPVGSVGYAYEISKFAISRDMVNKANAEGGLALELFDLSLYGGNGLNRPATGVGWNGAARFVNWLNISQGFQPAYKFPTQPGDFNYGSNYMIELWQPNDEGYNPENPYRNDLARYFLPSVDEWYKAAYYDPNKNGGSGGYWNFSTGSDAAPTPVAEGTLSGTAVYDQPDSQGPADVDNAGGLSPYGIMGLAGNVFEWQETSFDRLNNDPMAFRGARGGHWSTSSGDLSRINMGIFGPNITETYQSGIIGFRVASRMEIGAIPEPNSGILFIGICLAIGQIRRR
jgi:sulfatase modifying factor 1